MSTTVEKFYPWKKQIKLLIALLLFFNMTAYGAKPEKIRTIEGISEYRLDNGLQVLLFPDQSKDTFTVNVTYKVGSKHENYGETGMAHLLEHLLFKGSKNHPDITQELTEHGAKANGTTYLERTNYYETLKATDENLEWALSMEADRMVNAFVSEEDLKSEMTVVRNEFERGENNPWRILVQRIYSVAFDWHNYGNSTIGARSDIENVDIANLKAFYKKYYQPDNATLIVAGKFDEQTTLKIIRKTFGKIKRPKRQLPIFYTQDPVQDGERQVTLRRVGGEQVVAAAYHIPPAIHEDSAAISVLANILGDTPSGRMHENLIEKSLATSSWAWPNQQQDSSLIYFNATADKATDIERTRAELLNTIESIADTPITGEEVERAKRKILKSIELAFNDSQGISINLSEWIGIGDWRLLFISRDRIEAVTQVDVQRVVEKYLIPNNRTLGLFIPTEKPERAEIPEAPKIEDVVDGYTGKKEIAQGENFDATWENINERQIIARRDGIEIASVPIKTRGESVFLQLRIGIGNEDSLQDKQYAREFAAAMLNRGTKQYDRQTLQDKFDALKAQGGFSSGGQSIYASYQTTEQFLPELISLIHEVLSTPIFPEKEFELLKSQQLSKLNTSITDPQALALATLNAKLNSYKKGHIFYQGPLEERISGIKQVSLKDVKEFYKSHFHGAEIQVGIAGQFDHETISDLVFDKFKDWKSKIRYERAIEEFMEVEPSVEVIETPDKKNAIFLAGKNININHRHKDAPALYIATRILGGGMLSSRFADRIRQQDGLSYGVGAGLRLSRLDNNGRWLMYAISAPSNTHQVEIAFKEEIQKALTDGFTGEEVKTAITGLLDSAKVQRSDNGALSQTIRDFLQDDYEIPEEIDFQGRLKAVTVEEVNNAMRKYLEPQTMTIVKAGDFAAAVETKEAQ